MKFSALLLGILALAASPAIAQSQADTWPGKAVKVVVPFPPGGSSDLVGRLAADELSRAFGQPFVVENRSGAGGVVGTQYAVSADPDGYTLMVTGIGTNAIVHALDPKVSYNSGTDFAHISQIVSGPVVLVAHPDFPGRNVQELVAHARTNPGKLNYATTHGSSGHLIMELLKQTASQCRDGQPAAECKPVEILPVTYRGAGQAVTDLLGGQVPLMAVNLDTVLPHIRAGKLRALAVSSERRSPLAPDVPTVAESGFPGFAAQSWVGLSAPRGTPPAIVARIQEALARALATEATRARLQTAGLEPVGSGSQQYTDLIRSEIQRWTSVVKKAGITAAN